MSRTPADTCYIAGPMTGYPGFNYQAFDEARDALIIDGWDVISPADLDRVNLGIDFSVMTGTEDLSEHRTAFARQDIDALLKVGAVFVLDGWEKSTGARNEMDIATMLGVPIYSFTTGKPLKHTKHFSAVQQGPLNVSPRRDMLNEAADLVDGDRNAQYGDPRQDFQRTATMWSAYLDADVQPHDVAALMVILKVSRIRWSPTKRDSWVDLAGYAACGWHCAMPDEAAAA